MKRRINRVFNSGLGVLFALPFLTGPAEYNSLDRQLLAFLKAPTSRSSQQSIDLDLIKEAWNKIQRSYVGRAAIKPRELTYGAISGMVDALGDTGHSTFLTPDMLKAQHAYAKGEFEGIGAQVQMKEGRVVIVSPMDGSPAQKAGLKPGDVILKAAGEDLAGLTIEQAIARITGKAGTSVTLTILTPDTGMSREVTLIRASINVKNVTWRQLPDSTAAHLRIAGFSRGVTDNLRESLDEIKKKKLTGIVLDLRNNPGGLLQEAIETASQFLKDGNVLKQKDAKAHVKGVPVQPGGLAPEIPLVVLVNEGTASAPEIVAGALKDANRARIVGEKTFGTGTVLEEIRLSDGSALLLAVEEWLTPAGNTIWHKGITPDETISLPHNVSPLTPANYRDMTREQFLASNDRQLLRALDLLREQGERQ